MRLNVNDVATLGLAALVVAILTLAGCTTLTHQQEAQIQANANRRVTCSKGADCDTKWGRAVAWISQNSRWKIQIQNEHMIQTYTAVGGSPSSSFLVNKVPVDNDTFEIVMTSGCDNIFGCTPDAATLKAMFTNFLIGPAPAVSTPISTKLTTIDTPKPAVFHCTI